ncbi:hypothetical protein PG987_014785 [Apiospora arundinis]
MSLLLVIPSELLHQIAGHLDNGRDLKAFALVSRRFYAIATEQIFRPTRSNEYLRWRALMWACSAGSPQAVHRLHLASNSIANVDIRIARFRRLRFMTPGRYLDIPAYEVVGPHTRFQTHMHGPGPLQQQCNNCSVTSWKPLHMAIYHAQPQMVETLLQLGADPNGASWQYGDSRWDLSLERGSDASRYTPLYVALCASQEEIAKLLLSNGASIHVDHHLRHERTYGPDHNRLTAFHICAVNGLVSMALFLTEQGYAYAIDTLDEFGVSPMMYAYREEQDHILIFLLSRGASTRVASTSVAYTHYGHRSFFDADAVSSVLHQACLDGRWATLVRMVKHGADPLEPDRQGRQPLLLCIIHTAAFTGRCFVGCEKRARPCTKRKLASLRRVLYLLKSCGIHRQAQGQTLTNAMSYALTYVMMPLVTFLIDRGFDVSTLVEHRDIALNMKRQPPERPAFPMTQPECRTFDPEPYYLDTGRHSTQLTLLDHACFYAKEFHTLGPRALVKFLIRRGCLAPGDTDFHVRALKNLAAGGWQTDDRRREVRYCSRLICAHLSATLANGESKRPWAPADLVYICFDRGLDVMLAELAKAFELNNTGYNKTELCRLFECLTDHNAPDRNTDTYEAISNRHDCLKFFYQLDGDKYILQRDDSFERLCRAYLSRPEGEQVIVDFLKRGGKHCLIFSSGISALREACENHHMKLAMKLLDRGADLYEVLVGFCSFGQYNLIQEMRATRAKTRIDAIFRFKATGFLQKLLFNLSPMSEIAGSDADFDTIRRLDEAINTMKLLLSLGPSNILTSSCRLRSDQDEATVFEVIEDLLIAPPNPHQQAAPDVGQCTEEIKRQYQLHWCLEQRIKTSTTRTGKPRVSILDGQLNWPDSWSAPGESLSPYSDEVWVLGWIPSPWGCDCTPPYEPDYDRVIRDENRAAGLI